MIAIVGGGLIGASIAFELARAGADIVVLDAGKRGAAWRAGAGMLTPTGERLHGTPLDELAEHSLRLWPDFARSLARASGLDVPFRSGIEHVNSPCLRPLDPSTLRPHEATTHPPTVVRAALHRLDVRRAEVLELEQVRGGVRLITDAGPLTAERVVLAAGAWSGRFGLPVFPVRGQALLLTGSPGLPARYSGKRRGFPLYGLPRPDGHYIGATVRPHCWDPAPRPSDARWLHRAACVLWPEADTLRPQTALVGLRPGTADDLPIVGALPGWDRRVLVATGHGRHGALLAPATAQHIAKELL
ncbi:putative D-amino acid oxidase [Deinococcus piscis]|uniref:D-amino acid oxidase n=1 Tax=Deinococcus piscis TaxID=394230 RepID=A0ABQ3K9H2_9DEIO|nr:FAD-dependent oxidoreductase [Deinococcus piscis]GHG05504.1 putative D-amino acid oxidase [Deinococcus piscis]